MTEYHVGCGAFEMYDLISRKAVLEAIEVIATSRNEYIESLEERYIKMVKGWVSEIITDLPSVPAVPLDKLCEWLAKYVAPPVTEWCVTLDERTAAWKVVLNKFVEEQDAKEKA